jgi:serine/threonine protein kinase/alpha-tubulin suppressor-like RCC1 family protein
VAEEATLPEVRELEADYEILAELGRGGMAIVYLARDRQLGRDVAIKVIHAAIGVDDTVVARQLLEARTVAQLQHPNVVAMYAVKRLSTRGLALVMQYIPGRSLDRAIHEDGPFSPERAEAVLSDIAAALAYAHARGVVHRDVKPENIFLNDETGRALLSDFGIALSAEGGKQEATTDLLVGTPAYMSPEQIDGIVIDGRSDLFSLGIVGYEMLTGIRSWVDEPVSDVMYRQKFEWLPPLAECRPDVPDRVRIALERAMQKNRDARWESAGAFLAALTDDEWVPLSTPVGPVTGSTNRVAAHLATTTPRPTPLASTVAPLETVQFRRSEVAADGESHAPHRGMFVARRSTTTPASRGSGRWIAALVGIPLLLVAAAVVQLRRDPALQARASRWLAGTPDGAPTHADSVQAARLDALRDSAARAESLAARHAADSAALAVAAADSAAAARLVAARDSEYRALARAESTRVATARAAAKPVVVPPPTAPTPVAAPAAESTVVPVAIHPPAPSLVSAGGAHTCEVTGGAVLCWGANDRGQLGDGTAVRRTGVVHVESSVPFTQVSVSVDHSCAISRAGTAYCWGANDDGQLGTGDAESHMVPTAVTGGRTFRVVVAGGAHSCALTAAGEAYCWGRNSYGQLGTGSTAGSDAPQRVATAVRFVAIAAGTSHTCGLDAVGKAYCWGQNSYGQLGDGSVIVRTVPEPVAGDTHFRTIAAGNAQTCGLTVVGDAWCWGRNSYGQLGTGDTQPHDTPTRVHGDVTFVAITAGSVHSCALTAAGEAFCWGHNSYGQLGDGTTTDHVAPVHVLSTATLAAIDASGSHTCATTTAGSTVCWGDNSDGQLGDGTTTHRSSPVAAAGGR